MDLQEAKQMLDLAARLGWRGVGRVEPNPLVGCVIVRPGGGPARERIIGLGHHPRFGGPHAEAMALADCRQRGLDPAGATMYVTLEPCNAQGRNPPCSQAVAAARVARVVCAQEDPNPLKSGGAATLRAAGVEVEFTRVSSNATRLSEPFRKRLATGLPWVIAKWAQTIDGKVATRTGQSQWISGERSRRLVHLTRARVDAVLTGVGTAKADDPMLTARNVPLRRVARRVVLDPGGELPPGSKLLNSPDAGPVLVFSADGAPGTGALPAGVLRESSALLPGEPSRHGRFDLAIVLRTLRDAHAVSSVLCECGPGLQSELWRAGLIDELHVYLAPRLMGDDQAMAALRGFAFEHLADVPRMDLVLSKRVGEDVLLAYRRPLEHAPASE